MRDVPFYSNTKDNLHCYQAALRIVLKYFLPKKDFTFKQLDDITGKKAGLWTWPTCALIALTKMGFDVRRMSLFDYESFAREGENYLLRFYGKEKGKASAEHSDVAYEQKNARALVHLVRQTHTEPKLSDIRSLLQEGYLLICLVNSRKLASKEGYVGHFIVVYKCDEEFVYMHDPGLPPLKSRKIPNALFVGAWAYPDSQSANISAFRL